ncbi:MAG: lanthionine synthetase C family protein [Sciscionella sp.]
MTATSTDLHRLGEGAAGTALVLVEQARRGIIRWDEAHRMITTITAAPIDASTTGVGLFRGAPAVGYLLHRAARPGYAAALAALDDAIDTATRTRLAAGQERIRRGEPTTVGEYDLISGLTGLGVYHMVRHRDTRLLPDILEYLVALTRPLRVEGRTLPGWWCGDGPAGVPSPDYPNGHANFGMAHGITGPLALLSAAMIAGITVSGHHEAIERICTFLDGWRQQDTTATWWPEVVSLAEHEQGRPARTTPGRPSWCYGVAGVARAQQLAGRARGDASRQQDACDALTTALGDERQLEQITEAGLCHGWAGLLHTARRVTADTPKPQTWTSTLDLLASRIDDHVAQRGMPRRTGLLDGRAGLDLLDRSDGQATTTAESWDACLLLTFPAGATAPNHTATRTTTA